MAKPHAVVDLYVPRPGTVRVDMCLQTGGSAIADAALRAARASDVRVSAVLTFVSRITGEYRLDLTAAPPDALLTAGQAARRAAKVKMSEFGYARHGRCVRKK